MHPNWSNLQVIHGSTPQLGAFWIQRDRLYQQQYLKNLHTHLSPTTVRRQARDPGQRAVKPAAARQARGAREPGRHGDGLPGALRPAAGHAERRELCGLLPVEDRCSAGRLRKDRLVLPQGATLLVTESTSTSVSVNIKNIICDRVSVKILRIHNVILS